MSIHVDQLMKTSSLFCTNKTIGVSSVYKYTRLYHDTISH